MYLIIREIAPSSSCRALLVLLSEILQVHWVTHSSVLWVSHHAPLQ